MSRRILILGIGNVLWADEGFGVRCVEAMAETHALPGNVRLLDGGTQGLYLLPFLEEADALLVFDAIDYGLPPGTMKLIRDGEVPAFMGAKKMSLHQTGFQDVIATAALMGFRPPEMALIGCQPVELEDYGGGLRPLVAARIPEVLIATSCSKNFGIYRERTGCLLAQCADTASKDLAQGAMAFLNRQTYSFPPFHGAKIVATVLNTPELRADWMAELEEVRGGMLRLRQQLANELAQLSGSDRFAFIAQHRGMFSRLGATPEVVQKIKDEFAIYMVGDSRLNIAGLNDTTVPILARAIIEAGV